MASARPTNVVSFLRSAAERVGARPALILENDAGQDESISFAQLWDRVDRVSAGLRREGLAPGERAIVMIPMSIDLYVVLLAVLKLGGVAVFVDPWIDRRKIAAFAAFARPTAYLGIAKSHVLRLLEPALRSIRLSVTTGQRFLNLPARRTLRELLAQPGDGQVFDATPDDPALITFTTGSSGIPKGANRTHGFLAAQHAALTVTFPYRDEDIDMPMFPVFALNNLASGITSIVPRMDFAKVDQIDAAGILAQMRRHRVTACTASPPFYDRLAEHLKSGGEPLPLVRRVLTGGAPVGDSQLQSWQQAFHTAAAPVEIVVAYGSTEAEPVAHIHAEERLALSHHTTARPQGYCVGVLIPAITAHAIRIHAGPIELGQQGWSDWDVPRGEVGELVVSGLHVCKDYYLNPMAVAENKIVDADGQVWHRMGDTGYFDADGRFWLVGRVYSTIWRNGQTVHPQLLEQAARGADPRIRQTAALGLADGMLGERVAIVVRGEIDAEVEQQIRTRLADAGFPLDELIVSDKPLPVDPRHNSKIDYAELKRNLGR